MPTDADHVAALAHRSGGHAASGRPHGDPRGGRGHHRGDRRGYGSHGTRDVDSASLPTVIGFSQSYWTKYWAGTEVVAVAVQPKLTHPQRSTALGGAEILFVFVAAILVMVAAVTVVAEVDRWWVLVPVMVVALVTVLGVLATITHLLADDG